MSGKIGGTKILSVQIIKFPVENQAPGFLFGMVQPEGIQ
jgi:hypothetical protein